MTRVLGILLRAHIPPWGRPLPIDGRERSWKSSVPAPRRSTAIDDGEGVGAGRG